MNQESRKIKSFTDVIAWQKGHALVLDIYKMTNIFPPSEQFGLSNQLRRAAVSVTSNIAEGFSRKSYKEKVRFYYMALGSLTEAQNQLLVAKDVGYINKKQFDDIAAKSVEINKITNALIKKSNSYTS